MGAPTDVPETSLLLMKTFIQRLDGTGFRESPLTGYSWLAHGGRLLTDVRHRFFDPGRNRLVTLDDLVEVPESVGRNDDLVHGRSADPAVSWLVNLKAIG
ncbi:hypothetical protein [Herbidospora mongoliensis]|uniref:hypothetical protein n=1 Tax=Herbidospora mongoliensis TaxID=688067 RepID=UPI0012F81D43|nr:hypothetical protein [Herbidospora mongoliensis]